MTKSPRVSQIGKECVACGTCVPVCPKEAIQIRWGVSAHVDEEKCVGCGRCAKVCLRRSSTWWKGAVHCEKHKVKKGGRTTFGSPSCATCFWGCSISCSHGWGCCFSVSRCSSPFFGGSKAYCNRYCGRGQLFQPAGRKAEIVPEHPAAQASAQPVVPLWFFNLLYGDVRPDAVQHLPGIYRRAPFADGDASVGVQAPVAVGGHEFCGPVDRAVCLRLFRRYAHLDGAGPFDKGIVPAPVVVRILPDGNHDQMSAG